MDQKPDLLVVGAGIVGLWVAKCGIDAGMSVEVVEARHSGAGASGSVLGALLPHLPDATSEKRRFQFEALDVLEERVSELRDQTGVAAGYARCGRIMPIRRQNFLERAQRAGKGCAEFWRSGMQRDYRVDVRPSQISDWLDPVQAPLGVLHDDLSARIIPERYIAALRAFVSRRARLTEASRFAVEANLMHGSNAQHSAGHVVIAAGHGSFSILRNLTGADLGHGVKGEAVVFEAPASVTDPIIYDNGLYIVPHPPDRVSVGSTTRREWRDEHRPDRAACDRLVGGARALSPRLRHAPVVATWAGVRPRCFAGDPIIGPIDETGRLHVATGGYKTSFGVAHRLGRHLVEKIAGGTISTRIPETFTAAHHLAASARGAERRHASGT